MGSNLKAQALTVPLCGKLTLLYMGYVLQNTPSLTHHLKYRIRNANHTSRDFQNSCELLHWASDAEQIKRKNILNILHFSDCLRRYIFWLPKYRLLLDNPLEMSSHNNWSKKTFKWRAKVASGQPWHEPRGWRGQQQNVQGTVSEDCGYGCSPRTVR